MRIALGVEYDGSVFEGWQTQPHGRSVQDALETALAEVAGAPVATVCAGRTDTGVHGTAQVVHFDAPAPRPLTAWVRGANTYLPRAAAVRWAVEVPAGFHARYAAQARRYRYVLLNQPTRPAVLAGKVGWFHAPLDEARMAAAAAALPGEHDFSAFRAAACQAKSPIRHLREARVQRLGSYVLFDFCANGFLHHMVRNLVGALVYVGKGRYPPDWLVEVLAGRERSRAAPTFAPDGLYLCGVEYGGGWSLPDGGRIIAAPPIPFV
jgi:tRNA pseudouridine38-40 synthase